MPFTANYERVDVLHDGRNSRVYLARRKADGASVVLKILNEDLPSPERRSRFQQEYQLMRKLGAEGVLNAIDLQAHQGMKVMVLEYFGGASLDKLDMSGLPLAEWLQIAIRIAECLGQLHARKVIHKDINPSNIVWNRKTGQLKLIDLGHATELAREVWQAGQGERFEGTPAYVSPEQTGRMNRAVDHRSDFYSLGVTFYELLTGRLPYAATDMLELVHAHIAVVSEPVNHVRPQLPATLGAIVTKLMGKMAEDRYQSAAGLAADLKTCLRMLQEQGRITPFALGTQDFPDRLQVSQKLYGREKPLQTLMSAFDRASLGPAELLLVAGYSGVGKSSLVREVHKPIIARKGLFISGKFDQFKRDIPYLALVEAIRGLLRHLLTQSESEMEQWRARLLQALGNNAQAVIDFIPDLELVLGPQPALAQLPPDQAQNRFKIEFRKFLQAFATEQSPLVIFIDDLQWADLASLQLLAMLLRPPAARNFLVIGAYRDNEVNAAHPLHIVLQDIAHQGTPLRQLDLVPLVLGDVAQLLVDTLVTRPESVEPLARLCFDKTRGNPFFLNQFLETLASQGMLARDAQGEWRWDIAAIDRAAITDNVVELVLDKLHRLPQSAGRILQAAACLGSVFDLQMLAWICRLPQREVADLLWPALQEGLVLPLNDHYKFVGGALEDNGLLPRYRFLHDRVQQAAQLLLDERERAALHLAVGRLWRETMSATGQQERLFDLVNHLNLGRALIEDRAELRELAQLNLAAARKAAAAFARKPALAYAQAGLALMKDSDWDHQYELMLALHLQAAQGALSNRDYGLLEEYVAIVLRQGRSLIERAQVSELQVRALVMQSRWIEVMQLGLRILSWLGVHVPAHPRWWHAIWARRRTYRALAGMDVDQVAALPAMTDPQALLTCRLLALLVTSAYVQMPAYMLHLRSKGIELVLRHGLDPTSAFAFSGSTWGGRYREIALRLMRRREALPFLGRTELNIHAFVDPWIMPLQQVVEPLHQAYLDCVEMGDIEFASYAAGSVGTYAILSGEELAEVDRRLEHYTKAIDQLQHSDGQTRLSQARQVIRELIRGPDASAPDPYAKLGRNADGNLRFITAWRWLMLSCIYRNVPEAGEHVRLGRPHMAASNNAYAIAVFCFYESLALLWQLRAAPWRERLSILRQVTLNQIRMRRWARRTPANFLHKWYLVQAELARYQGRHQRAADCYEQAIQLALRHNFLHLCALARELAAEHCLERGHMTAAQAHARQAWRDYRRWGALAKAQQMQARYPQWFRQDQDQAEMPFRLVIRSSSIDGTVTLDPAATGNSLDLSAAVKATQALSQEIVLPRLLRQLMQVLMESAGAQRGMLLMKKDQHFLVEAERSGDGEAQVLQSQPVEEARRLPLAVVHYVARTGESLVMKNAAAEPLLAADPYVQGEPVRSLLCMPILHQGVTSAMLYLENNAAAGVFTEGRLEVLRLLATQAAISIENARLYAEMEERVRLRTAELHALTLRDGLTGLANRGAFDERIAEELARARRNGQPLSLLLIDIDHFKLVNDTYGHPAGDHCLRQVGALLASIPSRPVDFVARYGGEEFAMLLPETHWLGALEVAQRTLAAAPAIRPVAEAPGITLSIGVALSSEAPLGDVAGLVALADQRLYQAKAGGRDQVIGPGSKEMDVA